MFFYIGKTRIQLSAPAFVTLKLLFCMFRTFYRKQNVFVWTNQRGDSSLIWWMYAKFVYEHVTKDFFLAGARAYDDKIKRGHALREIEWVAGQWGGIHGMSRLGAVVKVVLSGFPSFFRRRAVFTHFRKKVFGALVFLSAADSYARNEEEEKLFREH